jgi:hypothetical protein
MRLIVLSARGIFTEYELQNARSEIAPCKNQYRAVVVWQAVPMQHLGASPT